MVDHLHHLRAHLFEVHAQTLQHTGGDALSLADQSEQQMLRADVVVIESACLVNRELDDLLRARREANIAGMAPDPRGQ